MCGICGIAYFDPERCAEREILSAMCRAIRHRGPDDQGMYLSGGVGLGSTRLSIIDVSGGHMPLSNEEETAWISFNGEIYNFHALRDRLASSGHRFATQTDTEAILHLYEEEGENFVHHLNGMFAVAIWDAQKRRLLLARDHMGIKPLYYAALSNRLVFASEIRPLLFAGVQAEVEEQALHDYLSLNYVPGPRTMLKGVRKLPAGHLLVCYPDQRKIEVRKYWDIALDSQGANGQRSLHALEDELLDLLRNVVRDQMISDVPLGAFLSGGIDSSTVVALMSQVSTRPVKTFSIGFKEDSYNELPYARIVARRYRTDHEELVVEPKIHDVIEAMADFFDEPFADNSAVAVFLVSQLAARRVKVALSGDGGDEVFGGYYTYQADKLAAIYRRLPRMFGSQLLPRLVELLPTSFEKASLDFKLKRFVSGASLPPLSAHYAWKAYLSEEMKFRLYAANPGNGNGHQNALRPTVELFQRYFDAYPSEDMLNRMLYVDNKIQLVDCMLTKVDRMSMAHSLEVRVPLLDRRLIDFMTGMPSQYKIRGLALKYLLKRVAKRILPAEILHRPKAGFTIPVARWLAGELRDLVQEQLSPAKIEEQGFFDPEAVQGMIDAHCRGTRDFSRSLWTLLVFSCWCDRYLHTPAIGHSLGPIVVSEPTTQLGGARSF